MREGWPFPLSTEIINQSIIGIEEFYLSQTEDYSPGDSDSRSN